MSRTLVPPIKCQGIKTKLVPLIIANVSLSDCGTWVEPFMGSGVVGLNVRPSQAIFSDINPHLVNFYNALKSGDITPVSARAFLEQEGKTLECQGEKHYYYVRDRFNQDKNPIDFLFLSRSCFNGMIRFNRKGGFNVPFCRKPQRFARAYVTKIVNQISEFCELLSTYDWSFVHQDFEETIAKAGKNDFIYCDPPYLGRHVDYFNSWQIEDENRLLQSLSKTPANFILSTWHSNKYRQNDFLHTHWSKFNVVTKEHFYHVGAKEDNRNSMLEALVMNYTPKCESVVTSRSLQLSLFDGTAT